MERYVHFDRKERKAGIADKTMSALKRREAREIVVGLLFESEFRADESYVEIFARSAEEREIPEDPYVRNAYYTIFEQREAIDEQIGKHAHGWRTDRMSKLSRSILRLAVYEMLYEKEIPYSVSINEAVELAKKFDDDKARPFINGILNSVKNELEAEASAN
jgi:N utilization substance protein B